MVDQRFLLKVMEAFGFNKLWLNWVYNCISTPRFLVLLNGSQKGFFEVSRGLHQGDPLSPFLFILMVKALGRAITKELNLGRIDGVEVTSALQAIIHQQFVNDMMLMGFSKRKEALQLNVVLNLYSMALGQTVNKEKSKVFFFNTNTCKEHEILRILNFKKGQLPCTYLGIPLAKGLRSKGIWDPLDLKLGVKLTSWKGRWLSWASRITMVRSVLYALPIYLLLVMENPDLCR